MIRLAMFALVPVWAMSLLLLTALPAHPASTESAAKVELSPALSKPLKAAQDAIKKGKWNDALEHIRAAQAVPNRTPTDDYTIDTMLGYALYRQKKFDDAVVVYERLLASPLLPPEEYAERAKAVAEMYFYAGNNQRASYWANKYLEQQPADSGMLVMLADMYYRSKDCRRAADTMQRAVALAEEHQHKPAESWLRLISNCRYQLHDESGQTAALRQLVRYYQKPEDWRALILRSIPDKPEAQVALGYRRLMFETKVLERAEDFEALLFSALDAGAPEEAQRVLEYGKKVGVFGGPDSLPGRYERLENTVQTQLKSARAATARLQSQAQADRTGSSDVKLGETYLSVQRYGDAIQSLRRGIDKGGLVDIDAAQISLGIAYLKSGRSTDAEHAFAAVAKDSKWADLATLWKLRAASSGK